MKTYIVGDGLGFRMPGCEIGDIVADKDTGNVSRIVADGRKGSTLHYVGNLYQPARDNTAQAIFDTVAAKLGALVPRCN